MDQFTRRIVGFEVHAGGVDGVGLCRMFIKAIAGAGAPRYLNSDMIHCLNFTAGRPTCACWGVEQIKTVPYAPLSHPFVERLIGIICREFLAQTLFWNAVA